MHVYHKGALDSDSDLDLDRDIKSEILDREEEKYLLIGGDISGIQRFIYNITSKRALKLLRARSFLLEMVSEDFVQELLDDLNLTRANLLYCAGGHFYILAPNTEECYKCVDRLKRALNEWLFDNFEGDLYYAIDYIPFSGKEFKDFWKLWWEIGEKLGEQKSKKFKEFMIDEPERFLREDWQDRRYHEKKQCEACKRFVHEGEIKEVKNGDETMEYCNLCADLLKVGGKLAKKENEFIMRLNKSADKFDLELPFSRIRIVNFVNKADEIDDTNLNTVFRINSFVVPEEVKKIKEEQGFTFTFVPLAMGNYSAGKDLDTLAKDAKGIDKIGVLRMDVDNLGRIFREGLAAELRTISRITNLSRFLNYFFKGYLNLLGEFKDDGDKNVRGICNSVWNGGRLRARTRENRDFTIVYAGGDDLLIVGSWDDVFELAFDINALFRKYVGENDDITISGGFCIFDPKFPFYKMAEISGKKEEQAKEEGRNRVWILERGIGIEREGYADKYGFKESIGWEKFLDTWHDFRPLLNGKELRVSKGTLTKLLAINSVYKENPDKIAWALELAYWYGRLQESEKRYFEVFLGFLSALSQ